MFKRELQRWTDFSSSETKPLFWLLIGPLLMMLTLMGTFDPVLSLISIGGTVMCWHYRGKGVLGTWIAFILYSTLCYILAGQEVFWDKIAWGSSLMIGVFISFLCMEEVKDFYSKQRAKGEKEVADLKISLHSSEEKSRIQRRALEKETEEIKQLLKTSQDEVESLLSLVEASQIEAGKVFRNRDVLLQEALNQHRQLETLQQKFTDSQAKCKVLDENYESLSCMAKTRLKMLNNVRVELYQKQVFIEGFEKQLKRAREYFLSQRKVQPSKQKPFSVSSLDKGEREALQALEKNKGTIKKTYDQISKDFQSTKEAFEEGKLQLAKNADPEVEVVVKNLDIQLKKKKKELEKTKAELIGLEREIFVTKKGLQANGAFAS